MSCMKVADFDFFLPKSLIAQKSLKERDSSRLLVLHRDGMIEHRRFSDLPLYLESGDMLLINNTKVSLQDLLDLNRQEVDLKSFL